MDERKNWQKHTIVCPKCIKPIIIKEIHFTSDGDVRISGICKNCAVMVAWETEILTIMTECAKSERKEEELKPEKIAERKRRMN